MYGVKHQGTLCSALLRRQVWLASPSRRQGQHCHGPFSRYPYLPSRCAKPGKHAANSPLSGTALQAESAVCPKSGVALRGVPIYFVSHIMHIYFIFHWNANAYVKLEHGDTAGEALLHFAQRLCASLEREHLKSRMPINVHTYPILQEAQAEPLEPETSSILTPRTPVPIQQASPSGLGSGVLSVTAALELLAHCATPTQAHDLNALVYAAVHDIFAARASTTADNYARGRFARPAGESVVLILSPDPHAVAGLQLALPCTNVGVAGASPALEQVLRACPGLGLSTSLLSWETRLHAIIPAPCARPPPLRRASSIACVEAVWAALGQDTQPSSTSSALAGPERAATSLDELDALCRAHGGRCIGLQSVAHAAKLAPATAEALLEPGSLVRMELVTSPAATCSVLQGQGQDVLGTVPATDVRRSFPAHIIPRGIVPLVPREGEWQGIVAECMTWPFPEPWVWYTIWQGVQDEAALLQAQGAAEHVLDDAQGAATASSMAGRDDTVAGVKRRRAGADVAISGMQGLDAGVTVPVDAANKGMDGRVPDSKRSGDIRVYFSAIANHPAALATPAGHILLPPRSSVPDLAVLPYVSVSSRQVYEVLHGLNFRADVYRMQPSAATRALAQHCIAVRGQHAGPSAKAADGRRVLDSCTWGVTVRGATCTDTATAASAALAGRAAPLPAAAQYWPLQTPKLIGGACTREAPQDEWWVRWWRTQPLPYCGLCGFMACADDPMVTPLLQARGWPESQMTTDSAVLVMLPWDFPSLFSTLHKLACDTPGVDLSQRAKPFTQFPPFTAAIGSHPDLVAELQQYLLHVPPYYSNPVGTVLGRYGLGELFKDAGKSPVAQLGEVFEQALPGRRRIVPPLTPGITKDALAAMNARIDSHKLIQALVAGGSSLHSARARWAERLFTSMSDAKFLPGAAHLAMADANACLELDTDEGVRFVSPVEVLTSADDAASMWSDARSSDSDEMDGASSVASTISVASSVHSVVARNAAAGWYEGRVSRARGSQPGLKPSFSALDGPDQQHAVPVNVMMDPTSQVALAAKTLQRRAWVERPDEDRAVRAAFVGGSRYKPQAQSRRQPNLLASPEARALAQHKRGTGEQFMDQLGPAPSSMNASQARHDLQAVLDMLSALLSAHPARASLSMSSLQQAASLLLAAPEKTNALGQAMLCCEALHAELSDDTLAISGASVHARTHVHKLCGELGNAAAELQSSSITGTTALGSQYDDAAQRCRAVVDGLVVTVD